MPSGRPTSAAAGSPRCRCRSRAGCTPAFTRPKRNSTTCTTVSPLVLDVMHRVVVRRLGEQLERRGSCGRNGTIGSSASAGMDARPGRAPSHDSVPHDSRYGQNARTSARRMQRGQRRRAAMSSTAPPSWTGGERRPQRDDQQPERVGGDRQQQQERQRAAAAARSSSARNSRRRRRSRRRSATPAPAPPRASG